MKIKYLVSSIVLLFAACSVATALDEIHIFSDKANAKVSGTIGSAGIGRDAVSIRGRRLTKVPVSQIKYILFDKDPKQVADAKILARNDGGYDEALRQFKLASANNLTGSVKTDVKFYTLLCRAKRALAGQDELRPIAKDLNIFINQNGSSYHYYEANELLGDLLKSLKKYSKAATFYGKLAGNPDYAMRANVGIGWVNFEQSKLADAEASFDKVLADRKTGPEADRQRHSARLGKASCMAEGGNTDEAIQLVEKVIAQANPADWALHARTYNVLGKLHVKANRKKPAILAHLHVHLLYSQDPSQHAEALDNLDKLFTAVNQPQNALKARRALKRLREGS